MKMLKIGCLGVVGIFVLIVVIGMISIGGDDKPAAKKADTTSKSQVAASPSSSPTANPTPLTPKKNL